MRRRRGQGWVFQRESGTWYAGYFANGKKRREAAGPRRADALALLAQRQAEVDRCRWQPNKPLAFDDLLALVTADWRNRGKKSSLTTPKGNDQSGVKHLREAFGMMDIRAINAAVLAGYANDRQNTGAAKSTVRNELNILKRGMTLAVRHDLLATRPAFPTIVPTNVRTGFFERAELEAIVRNLPEHVAALVKFMYWTGWRRGEVLSRQWRHVDEAVGVISLEAGETKNGKGRDFPYDSIPELRAVIAQQRAYTDEIQRRTGQVVPWLFHRDGNRIRSFRNAWKRACKRTGLARIPHDFRRTAARNLVRAGVIERVAMELTGHLTRSVFERYNITTDRDRREAVAKLAAAVPDQQVRVLLDPKRTQQVAV